MKAAAPAKAGTSSSFPPSEWGFEASILSRSFETRPVERPTCVPPAQRGLGGGGPAGEAGPAMFEFHTAALVYCFLVAALFLALWFYYDRRDHRRFERERRKITFHCIRCDRLYAAPTGTEPCPCPKCGHPNTRLRF